MKQETLCAVTIAMICSTLGPGWFPGMAGNAGNHGNDEKFHKSHQILSQI